MAPGIDRRYHGVHGTGGRMIYDFLIDSYETERIKVLTMWSMFPDDAFEIRPRQGDPRGRTLREHMIHQCVSENTWFCAMLGIDVGAPPLPEDETRLAFLARYATDSDHRLAALRQTDEAWWKEQATFFELHLSRAWIMTRRIAHTAHHRGQQSMLLRQLGRALHSTYGPTADTGGLMQHQAPVIYPYPDVPSLLAGERAGGARRPLPGPGAHPSTERPSESP